MLSWNCGPISAACSTSAIPYSIKNVKFGVDLTMECEVKTFMTIICLHCAIISPQLPNFTAEINMFTAWYKKGLWSLWLISLLMTSVHIFALLAHQAWWISLSSRSCIWMFVDSSAILDQCLVWWPVGWIKARISQQDTDYKGFVSAVEHLSICLWWVVVF